MPITLEEFREGFSRLIKEVEDAERENIFKWIESFMESERSAPMQTDKIKPKLREISAELRTLVPFTGIPEKDSEGFHYAKPTIVCDEFLYEDIGDAPAPIDVEKARYCLECGSRNIDDYDLVSHSASIERIKCLYEKILPPLDGGTILDIGSGLGAILYGAFYYTDAKKIIAGSPMGASYCDDARRPRQPCVEISKELCNISKKIVKKWEMEDRVHVVNADIQTQAELIASADVILCLNSFEYQGNRVGLNCWKTIQDNVKLGAILVISPPAPETFRIYKLDIEWPDWLRELKTSSPLHDDMSAYLVTSAKENKS